MQINDTVCDAVILSGPAARSQLTLGRRHLKPSLGLQSRLQIIILTQQPKRLSCVWKALHVHNHMHMQRHTQYQKERDREIERW